MVPFFWVFMARGTEYTQGTNRNGLGLRRIHYHTLQWVCWCAAAILSKSIALSTMMYWHHVMEPVRAAPKKKIIPCWMSCKCKYSVWPNMPPRPDKWKYCPWKLGKSSAAHCFYFEIPARACIQLTHLQYITNITAATAFICLCNLDNIAIYDSTRWALTLSYCTDLISMQRRVCRRVEVELESLH